MADEIEFQVAEGSEGQRIQRATGTLGLLARQLDVDLVTGADFIAPFNETTGALSDEQQTRGNTGAPGTARRRGTGKPTADQLGQKWPIMRGRT